LGPGLPNFEEKPIFAYLAKLATGPYSKPRETSPHPVSRSVLIVFSRVRLVLPIFRIPSGVLTKILCAFFCFSQCAAYSALKNRHDNIIPGLSIKTTIVRGIYTPPQLKPFVV
jgi:hypothetical protein